MVLQQDSAAFTAHVDNPAGNANKSFAVCWCVQVEYSKDCRRRLFVCLPYVRDHMEHLGGCAGSTRLAVATGKNMSAFREAASARPDIKPSRSCGHSASSQSHSRAGCRRHWSSLGPHASSVQVSMIRSTYTYNKTSRPRYSAAARMLRSVVAHTSNLNVRRNQRESVCVLLHAFTTSVGLPSVVGLAGLVLLVLCSPTQAATSISAFG